MFFQAGLDHVLKYMRVLKRSWSPSVLIILVVTMSCSMGFRRFAGHKMCFGVVASQHNIVSSYNIVVTKQYCVVGTEHCCGVAAQNSVCHIRKCFTNVKVLTVSSSSIGGRSLRAPMLYGGAFFLCESKNVAIGYVSDVEPAGHRGCFVVFWLTRTWC